MRDSIGCRKQNLPGLLPILLLLFLGNAQAQDDNRPSESFLHRDTLTGNWGGARGRLEKKGIYINGTITADFLGNVSGGIERKGAYIDNVDLTLRLNLENLLGWEDASIFVYGLGINGRNPSIYVGDAQGVSNIGAPAFWNLYEIWIQQNIEKQHLSILAGYYDLNTEFDYLEAAQVFLNSSHGIDPTFAFSGRSGPSIFPYTTLGARIKWIPSPHLYLQSALLNGAAGDPGNPDGINLVTGHNIGVLSVTEIGYLKHGTTTSSSDSAKARLGRFELPGYAGKIAVGGWFYTAKFKPFDAAAAGSALEGGNHGLYFVGEKILMQEETDPGQGLHAFMRAGIADSEFNRFRYFAGGGLIYYGPGKRSKDHIGAAFAAAFNGSPYRNSMLGTGARVDRSEWDLEVVYHAQLTPWLALNPDIQYVFNPNNDPRIKNALVAGTRLEVSF